MILIRPWITVLGAAYRNDVFKRLLSAMQTNRHKVQQFKRDIYGRPME